MKPPLPFWLPWQVPALQPALLSTAITSLVNEGGGSSADVDREHAPTSRTNARTKSQSGLKVGSDHQPPGVEEGSSAIMAGGDGSINQRGWTVRSYRGNAGNVNLGGTVSRS